MKALNREILALALPAIVSNITTPLLGLIDVAIVGHFGAAAYLGAIAVGTTMFNMLYWLFAFLRMGTAGIAAQAHGAANEAEASATLRRGLLMAVTFGSLMLALAVPLCAVASWLLHVEGEVAPQAHAYFYIAIAGAPAVLGTYVLNGWLLGRQNTRLPMWVALMTNVANTALSLTFVFGLGWRIEGVALGTALSQWLGFAVCLVATVRRYRPQAVAWGELLRRSALARLFRVNVHIFLRTLCLVAVTMWFTRRGGEFGVNVLAANALLMQLFMFFSYFSDGFAFAAEALAGKAEGAGDRVALLAVERATLRRGLEVAIAFTAVYLLAGRWIVTLLTDVPEVVATAGEYLPWAVAVPLCGILAFIYDGIFIGLTRTRAMLLSMFFAMVIYFAVERLLSPALGNHALWFAFVLYLAARGVYLWQRFRRL